MSAALAVVRHAVVDTNVLCSALMNPVSPPGKIVQAAREGRVALLAPITVAWELERVIPEVAGFTLAETERAISAAPLSWTYPDQYGRFMEEASAAIRDPDDAPLVAAALALRTGVISGDGAFHPLLGPVVPTWRPRAFLDLVEGADH